MIFGGQPPRPVKTADEYDYYTRWRRFYHWNAGVGKAIKRGTHKRERSEARRHLRDALAQ